MSTMGNKLGNFHEFYFHSCYVNCATSARSMTISARRQNTLIEQSFDNKTFWIWPSNGGTSLGVTLCWFRKITMWILLFLLL